MKILEKYDLEQIKHLIPISSYSTKAGFTGFASPAENYLNNRLSLDSLYIRSPINTYAVKVSGNSMEKARIFDGDILIIHTDTYSSFNDLINRIVVAVVDGETVVKILAKIDEKFYFVSENDDYPPVLVTESMEAVVRGQVTSVHRAIVNI